MSYELEFVTSHWIYSLWKTKVSGYHLKLKVANISGKQGLFTIWMEFSVALSGQMELHFFFSTKETK